jgi:metal-dependent amidase/aminoacylase/carboxypeptidase family protein
LADIHYHLKSFALNYLGSYQPISLVPSIFEAGSACNVMPNEGLATYSMRNFLSLEDREIVVAKLKAKITAIVALYEDATVEAFHFYPCYPPLINPVDIYENTKNLLHTQNFTTICTTSIFIFNHFKK